MANADSTPLLVKLRQWLGKPMSPEEEEAYRRDLRERAAAAVAALKARAAARVEAEAIKATLAVVESACASFSSKAG